MQQPRNYDIIGSVNMNGGLNASAQRLGPVSENSLDVGSWNAIISGDGFTRPWSGATSQGAGTGSRKMLPFGSTWGGIKDIAWSDRTFTAPGAVGTNQVTATAHGYVTGISCTVSSTVTLPTGLVAATTYYLIVLDANTLAFATTLADALLGTATPITAATGSGTVTINVSNTAITASGNFFQDIGLSRWGIGAGQPHIAGVSVPGFFLSTNLQVQIPAAGVYGVPVQAGLSQPSAPEIGIINLTGVISNSISAKLERTRPSTGANSVASPTSAVIQPQANRIYVVFPIAQSSQTHWRVFFTLQGFGGVGIHYLGTYNGEQDIPESVVAAGYAGAGGAAATGSLTFVNNAANNETIAVNGVTFTFKTTAGAGEVQIGASKEDTAIALAAILNASANPSVSVATYTAVDDVVTVTYDTSGTAGNAFTLANSSSANVTRSGATLAGGVNGIARSLEFNFQDGDLIPIEASFDDYAPPAATHAIRLNNVMNLAGCYSDSSSDPTSTNPGTAIAVSKENNYESYVPTSLLYLPEQVVDVLARPLDDYGYIGMQNSISAIQYVGYRGDELPSCTITTILPDIGIEYPHNWCHFRGRLLIYTAQGNLLLMDEGGSFDSSFAGPVAKILKTFTTSGTAVGYDPINDSIVVMCGKHLLVYSIASGQWRQIWLPDYSITGTTLSCVAAARKLYFTVSSGGVNTAYTYDTGSATAPISCVSNYQNSGGAVVRDLYEMAIAAETNVSTRLAVVINRNLTKTAFRQISCTNGIEFVGDAESSFTTDMIGKKFILFGTNVGGGGTQLLQGTIVDRPSAASIELSVIPQATLSDCLMFVGDYAANDAITASGHASNFFPYLAELRSYQVATWLKGSGDFGNVLTVDLLGATYASSRAI